jgi:O-antigen/teichoic acid export membrane protein
MAFGRNAVSLILSAVAVAAVAFMAFAGRPLLGLSLAAGVVFVVALIWYRQKAKNHA